MRTPSVSRLFAQILVFCAVWANGTVALAQPTPTATERLGGIEIGAKGVKGTVLEITREAAGLLTSKTLKPEMISNTTIAEGVVQTGRFSPEAIRDTALESGRFAKRMRDEFKVPAEKIRVICSSGLPKASNQEELVKALQEATGLASIEVLDPPKEVKLTIAGLVPEDQRGNAVLVDVGSGSTKGGFLRSDDSVVYFSVPLGSVTYANRVAKEAPGKPFAEASAGLRGSLLESPLNEQVGSNPELSNRSTVFLSGGAPYALCTIMHPEAAREPRVVLSSKDIEKYAGLLRSARQVPKPDFDSIKAPEIHEAAEQEWRNVRDNFRLENLVAGAEVLSALSSTLKFEGKTLIFDRSGVTAWIRASLVPVRPSPQSISSSN